MECVGYAPRRLILLLIWRCRIWPQQARSVPLKLKWLMLGELIALKIWVLRHLVLKFGRLILLQPRGSAKRLAFLKSSHQTMDLHPCVQSTTAFNVMKTNLGPYSKSLPAGLVDDQAWLVWSWDLVAQFTKSHTTHAHTVKWHNRYMSKKRVIWKWLN